MQLDVSTDGQSYVAQVTSTNRMNIAVCRFISVIIRAPYFHFLQRTTIAATLVDEVKR